MENFALKRQLLEIAIIQLCILSMAWAFFTVVKIKGSLPLPDATAIWVYNNPTEATFVVTIIATAINVVTLNCFTRAARHALRQHIDARGTISLAALSIGLAAVSASFAYKRRSKYLGPVLGTLFIFLVFALVNSAWTTFLSPVQINVLVPINGMELDLGRPEFDAVLGQDINNTFIFSNGALVEPVPASSNSLTSPGFVGGSTRAATYASGQPLTFNFNNATYNVSTGGILSAVPGYGSTQASALMPVPETPASFGGGPVPSSLTDGSGLAGISSTYNIIQQGLTASVSCYNYTNPADWYPVEIEQVAVNATFEINYGLPGVPLVVNTTIPRIFCNTSIADDWNTASIAAINYNNTNYLASVICPAAWIGAMNTNRIVIYHSGVGAYSSLTPTICEIFLLLSQTSVVYSNQLIAVVAQNTTAIPAQQNLNFWVTLFCHLEQWTFQAGKPNTLGNMLLSLLTSGPPSLSEAPTQSFQLFLQEYWKGVIELAGTALRSGYAVYPQNVTSLQKPISGTRDISTVGWSFGNNARTYALIPITLAAFTTFAAILLALYPIRPYKDYKRVQGSQAAKSQNHHNGQTWPLVVPHTALGTFDVTNPVHLIVAAAAQRNVHKTGAAHNRRYWDQHEETEIHLQVERHGSQMVGHPAAASQIEL